MTAHTSDWKVAEALAALTLEEKVQLLTGRDFWTTWPIEKIGLRRILVSDGPSGIRGETWDERDPSLNLPSATALASSWDPDIARRYGAAAAVEARRKGVHVLLGPTINLHRSPLGGRHFEAFSEDPVLTPGLAPAYVHGVQDNGVGATPKHYSAHHSRTDQFPLDVRAAALAGFPAAEPVWGEDGIAVTRHAAVEGTVLLEKRGEVPWDRARLRSVAVIGDNAANARTQGGGSATVLPEHTVSPLNGLRAALPGVDVTYSRGAVVQEGVAELPLAQMINPATGEPGLRVRFLDADGIELSAEDRRSSMLVWFGGDAPIGRSATVELATRFTPTESGPVRVGFATVGHGQVYAHRQLILHEITESEHTDLGAALMAPPTAAAEVDLNAGTPVG